MAVSILAGVLGGVSLTYGLMVSDSIFVVFGIGGILFLVLAIIGTFVVDAIFP